MANDEVTLWTYREGQGSSRILDSKMSYLKKLAYQSSLNISETKLGTLARCFLALEAENIRLPAENMLVCEKLAISLASNRSEADCLMVVCVVQEKIKKIHQQL